MIKKSLLIVLISCSLMIFSASEILAGSATVSWSVNTEPDLSGYKVYYGTSPRTGTDPKVCSLCGYTSSLNVGNVTTHTFNSLTDGQTYYFSVSAYDTSNNESSFSSEVSKVIPAADTTPPAISAVVAAAITSWGATITWATNESSDSQVEYGLTAFYGSQIALNNLMVTSHSQAASGLSASTLYHYRVKSRDAAGNLATSGDYTFTTGVVSCTPRSLVNGSVSPASVSTGVSYTVSCDYGATTNGINAVVGSGSCTFQNFVGTAARFACTAGATSGTFSNSCTLSNTSPDYYCARTDGIASLVVTAFVPTGDTSHPTIPVNLSAVAISSSQINLSWALSTDNIGVAGYRIYRCQGSGCTPSAQIATSPSNSYSDTGLIPNTVYTYRVVAYDAAGNISGQSSSAFAATQTGSGTDTVPPGNIIDLLASDITQTSVRLLWSAPGDDGNVGSAKSYDLRHSTSLINESNWNSATQVNGMVDPVSPGSPQSMTVTGLSPGTTYYFAIKTSDEVPNTSSLSNIVWAATQGGSQPKTCNSFTYSEWSVCQPNSTQSRTIVSALPQGCTGGNPVLSQSCYYASSSNACVSFTYSGWSACQPNGTQSRTVVSSSPQGCSGGSPTLLRSCNYTSSGKVCSSFTYSDWSVCQPDSTQSRTVASSSPQGCSGGSLAIFQSCVYAPSGGSQESSFLSRIKSALAPFFSFIDRMLSYRVTIYAVAAFFLIDLFVISKIIKPR